MRPKQYRRLSLRYTGSASGTQNTNARAVVTVGVGAGMFTESLNWSGT